MQNQEVDMRFASVKDSQSIFDWRKDEHSKSMFFDDTGPTFKEHTLWFDRSLQDAYFKIYIGEVEGQKIGVCRFSYSIEEGWSEVSINMNPEVRGRGFGQKFLLKCVEAYLDCNKYDLVAKIKPHNHASIKIFTLAGFEQLSKNEEPTVLLRGLRKLSIREVVEEDADTLFRLLQKRPHSISHQVLPSKQEHWNFLKSDPYRYWAIIYDGDYLAGSFYVQNDNSIGLNLLQPEKVLVRRILQHIVRSIEPVDEIKSKVPAYFYINVAHANQKLQKILEEIGFAPIQISYKIS
jgi:RimJ/RimL family protein N-acetyltransferase